MNIELDRMSGLADEAGFELHTQLAAHRALGWKKIELRTIDHLAIDQLSLTQIYKIKEEISHAGLTINVISSRIGNWCSNLTDTVSNDIALLHEYIIRMKILGAKYLRVMSYNQSNYSYRHWQNEVINRYHYFTEIAHRENIVLLHENCTGWAGVSAENSLELMETINSEHLGLLFDIGNGVAYGYESTAFLQLVLNWVKHVHIKDAYIMNGKVIYCMPGDGASNVIHCLKLLNSNKYAGDFAIEPHICSAIHENKQAHVDTDISFNTYLRYGKKFMSLCKSVFNEKNTEVIQC